MQVGEVLRGRDTSVHQTTHPCVRTLLVATSTAQLLVWLLLVLLLLVSLAAAACWALDRLSSRSASRRMKGPRSLLGCVGVAATRAMVASDGVCCGSLLVSSA